MTLPGRLHMYIYRGQCSVFHRWWSQSGLQWHRWQDRSWPSSATSRCHTRCQLFRIADLWTDECRKNISFCPPTMPGTWYSSFHQLSSSYPQTHRGSWARSRSQIHPPHHYEAYLPQRLIKSLLGCAEAKRVLNMRRSLFGQTQEATRSWSDIAGLGLEQLGGKAGPCST